LEPGYPLSYISFLSDISVHAIDFKIITGLLILAIMLFHSDLKILKVLKQIKANSLRAL
jgi:hypothetical protein